MNLSWTTVLLMLIAGCAGFTVCWVSRQRYLVKLSTDLNLAQAQVKACSTDLETANRTVEMWRSRHETEQRERTKFETEARRVRDLQAELSQVRARAETLLADKSALQAEIREHAKAHVEKVQALTDVRVQIEKDLKIITGDALRNNQNSFLEIANEVFKKHKTGADADLETRQKAVEALVSPLLETLQGYKQQVDEMEKARSQSYGMLSAELKGVAEAQNAVRTETSKLVNALRAAPKTRGRWGEHTLRNVLELSGLSSYCDYLVEESFAREGSLSRPDVVIKLPGGRSIVIDAKTSLSAYLDAVDAIDEIERDRHLALHAAQIRSHVKQLAAKAYWDGLTVTPDFVVMFVPGDNFYAAAVERDPLLFEDAAAQRVIIVTPATLIALAKAVAFGWRQEKVAENVKHVHALGRELYKRIITMTSHIERCGDSLSKSVKHFNQFIGSLEHSVMPQARRFNELEVEGTATEVPALETIDVDPRLLRSESSVVEIGQEEA